MKVYGWDHGTTVVTVHCGREQGGTTAVDHFGIVQQVVGLFWLLMLLQSLVGGQTAL